MYQDVEEYINELIQDGYIAEDGTPLKCVCHCTDFKMEDMFRESIGLVEYSLKCRKCGTTVGHWAYGNWQV